VGCHSWEENMALYKRGKTWWIAISHQGTRIQESSGTATKVGAQRLHDKIKAQLWKVNTLKAKPSKDWNDAAIKWCTESQHKRSLFSDKSKFRWLDQHLNGVLLVDMTRDRIERIAQIKEESGASPATVNLSITHNVTAHASMLLSQVWIASDLTY